MKGKRQSMPAALEGRLERITYTNEENGFTIAKVKVRGQRGLVTIVGNLMSPIPGEILKMRGEWLNHPKYGEQFKVLSYKSAVPASVYGIQKYLGSGLIKGIGPVMAGRIVRKFGENTLQVIERKAEKLASVEGIGKKRVELIKQAWEEQKEIRDVMLFLQGHGVGAGYASKIFKHYGQQSIKVVSENPYRLATDIFGIGFLTADKIAQKLGFSAASQLRAEAGILYVLEQLSEEGHVYYPYEALIEKCQDMLETDREVILQAFESVRSQKRIVVEDLKEGSDLYRENHKGVFLVKYYVSETGIAKRMRDLIEAPKSIRAIDSLKAVDWVQRQVRITLAEKQIEAVRSAAESKVMVITGGPGTGKTTIINAVVKIFSRLRVKIVMAAPTGRAAKRMSESTGHEAKTIHRILEYSAHKGGFKRNEDHPIDCQLLIVDEASMIDTILMYHLLKALPLETTMILVGDVNQLPSVGAGNVLKDVIGSGSVPVVELRDIFRQARESLIIVNAHKVNNGQMPSLGLQDTNDDFYFVEQEDPEEVLRLVVDLVKERIPKRFGLDAVEEIQVITPMNKGIVGAVNLNSELQKALNPRGREIMRGNRTFRINDKVMQTRNNYDKEIFNGDIGNIREINLENQQVVVCFDGRKVVYNFTDLDELVPAYAVTVHKSQGSEYPAVVFPVLTQHYMLLQRNLIYTAITRGRKLVVMVGTKKAIAIGVHNDRTEKRYTYLKHRLRKLSPGST